MLLGWILGLVGLSIIALQVGRPLAYLLALGRLLVSHQECSCVDNQSKNRVWLPTLHELWCFEMVSPHIQWPALLSRWSYSGSWGILIDEGMECGLQSSCSVCPRLQKGREHSGYRCGSNQHWYLKESDLVHQQWNLMDETSPRTSCCTMCFVCQSASFDPHYNVCFGSG